MVMFRVVAVENTVAPLPNVMVVFESQNSSSQLEPIAQALHVQTLGLLQAPLPLQTPVDDASLKKI